jgi:DNA (cytosine-5)-methyltransferase 1
LGKVIEFNTQAFTALEFFSGIGLARAGMARAGIRTLWANDWDKTKCELYRNQWGADDLTCGDVFAIDPSSVPSADVAWASSPCTDLSLAGKREGLVSGRESSAFFGFIKVIEGMGDRRPKALVLENVCGLASSHDGDDFRTVVCEFNRLGYSVDAFQIDARRWLPQSRERMFVVGLSNPEAGGTLNSSLRPDKLAWIHADDGLVTHITDLPPVPDIRTEGFTELHEHLADDDPRWWDRNRQSAFEESLSDIQRSRFEALKNGNTMVARTAYRRTRNGRPVWEMRPDDIAGCLRTARGGSSKQAVVELGKGIARVRWMTGKEYAALQGVPDFDVAPISEPKVMYAFGDAVAVPVVSWLMRAAIIPSLVDASEEGKLRVVG